MLRRAGIAAGRLHFKGEDITTAKGATLRRLRRHMQMVFQDPYASLNPRFSVLKLIAEPLIVHGLIRRSKDASDIVRDLLKRVGLPVDAITRHPNAFSGGQRQRIAIARALALQPDLIVADEPVSALDVSIRAQVVNLMKELQAERNLAYLFIAHDLAVVRHISHRIAIMYAGKLVELADCNAIYENPKHPYTEALLSAVPIPNPVVERRRRRIVLTGEIPNLVAPPEGCRFHTRCPAATELCRQAAPPFEEKAPRHWSACWHR